MIHSIATVSVSGTLEEKLRAIAEAGFPGVEIFENDLVASDLSPETVRELLAELGLVCTVYQPFRDFEGELGQRRVRAFDRAERKFDVMQRLGTDLMLVCSSVSTHADGDHGRIAADFHALGERAGARGLRVAYEALAWGRHVGDHRDAAAIVAAANHRAVGLVLDSFHSLSRDIPIETLRDIDVNTLFLVQLADAPRLQMDVLQWSRHFRCMPGQGDLPVAAYVAALQELGYQGPLSLEIFNDRFRGGPTALVARDGLRSLLLVEDEARTLRGASPALPPRSACQGVEFIEFAASDDEATQLEAGFAAMGFTETGRHRRKAVSRWSQDAINFVINRERDSFAGSYDIVHGASVCAIGLRVADAEGVLERARALRVPAFTDAPDQSESVLGARSVPALRGVGGSLIYLIEQGTAPIMWEQEFEDPAPSSHPRGAGAASIDHLAAIVPNDEFLSWLLYWTSLFDMSKSAQTDLLDPGGLVHSQAMQTGDGALRITLNGSGPQQTLAARFVSHSFGAGFQHIALATDDIIATAERLQSLGLEILPIPANYYDDLGARFGIDRDRLATLRDHNILYDEDAVGNPFHQIYSRAFDKRFFFEFVQRGTYAGYGAANTQVRLTAQSRYRTPASRVGG